MKSKYNLILVLFMLSSILFEGCSGNSGGPGDDVSDSTAVAGIVLNKSIIGIEMGSTLQLIANVVPDTALNKNVEWSTSSANINVSSTGLVTPVSIGSAIVTATSEDGNFTATCNVSVTNYSQQTDCGGKVTVYIGDETLIMVYANNSSTDIVFPSNYAQSYDTDYNDDDATMNRKFFMGQTEITNSVFVEVFQWAFDNGKISKDNLSNLVNSTTVKFGNQELIDLDNSSNLLRISFNTATNKFEIESGFENYPVTCVSLYGAIMFCNWLTEMQNGNVDNLVYSGIDSTWTAEETVADYLKTGYRLPTIDEYEFAARWCGTSTGGRTDLVSKGVNGGLSSLTAGYYWTSGDYLSGATTFFYDTTGAPDYAGKIANELVAVCNGYYDGSSFIQIGLTTFAEVGSKNANQLGIYDMSGNLNEWCSTGYFFSGSYQGQFIFGGDWYSTQIITLTVSCRPYGAPDYIYDRRGFRLARTK